MLFNMDVRAVTGVIICICFSHYSPGSNRYYLHILVQISLRLILFTRTVYLIRIENKLACIYQVVEYIHIYI